jgi:omega-6 fatty acid desaturase (delta-12 desaturase)
MTETRISSKTINETELFMKYKSSYTSAFIDLSVHFFLVGSSFYSLLYFRNSWFVFPNMLFYTLLQVKTFTIVHDCCHNSYIPNSSLSIIISMITSILSNRFWLGYKTRHAIHHKTNGMLDNKYNFPFNETVLFTFKDYAKLNLVRRQIYKIIKHHCFVLVAGFLKFLIFEHFSFIRCKKYYNGDYAYLIANQIFFSVMTILYQYMFYKLGLLIHYFVSVNTVSYLILLIVHNEHTYNPPYVLKNDDWTYTNSGLLGSSLIKVPLLLKYFTGGLEYHHIHHMNAKIPGYNLQKYHEEVVSKSNMFDNIVELSITDCYNNMSLVLYDEDKQKYITFDEADEEIKTNKDI